MKVLSVKEVENVGATVTKQCPKCGRDLPASDYYKDKHSADGLQAWCKRCHGQAAAERARKARAEKLARNAERPAEEVKAKNVQVLRSLTDKQMVDILREHGWEVTCKRVITEEL